MNTLSFTSASTFPAKLLSKSTVEFVSNKSIKPLHIQLNPTNKCNLNCSFCSCKGKDDTEMTLDQVSNILERFRALGTMAVTISGGGDPLCHPNINEIIRKCKELNLEVGLVTNAILLSRLDTDLDIKWCRISLSGENLISFNTKKIIQSMPQVDWAFSYVMISNNYSNVVEAVRIANELKVTHIRIVDDILDGGKSYIEDAKKLIRDEGVDEKLVIYQGRKGHTKGINKCLISLIKPSIDAHGLVFPCCGVQYALAKPSMSYSSEFCMGDDYEKIWRDQESFDGSICVKCYYENYNNILNLMWDSASLEHKNFI